MRLRYTAATSGRSSALRGFLLDERRQRHDLSRRQLLRLGASPQRSSYEAPEPSTIIATTRAAGAARQRVGFGKQIALEIARLRDRDPSPARRRRRP